VIDLALSWVLSLPTNTRSGQDVEVSYRILHKKSTKEEGRTIQREGKNQNEICFQVALDLLM
jgi:hypothetical protein